MTRDQVTRDQVKEVIERVLTWPRERQEDAVQMLLALEAREGELYHPDDDEWAAIERGSLKPGVARPFRPTRSPLFSSHAIHDAPVYAPCRG